MKIQLLSGALMIALCSSVGHATECEAVHTVLKKMENDHWVVRHAGFRAFIRLASGNGEDITARYKREIPALLLACPMNAEEITVSLIGLLEKENAYAGTQTLSDVHANYYGDVIAAVATLRDAREIPALLDAITTGGMAVRALAEFGDDVFPAIRDKASDARADVRVGVLSVVCEMLAQNNLSDLNREIVFRITVLSCQDRSLGVRLAALSVLEKFGNKEAADLLRAVAQKDPSEFVRKAARSILTKIK